MHSWYRSPLCLCAVAALAGVAGLLAWAPARSVLFEHGLALVGRTVSVHAGPGAPGPASGRAIPPVVIPPNAGSSPYLVQLGATMSPNPRVALERLGVLAGRFPDRATLRAHLLWQAALGEINLEGIEAGGGTRPGARIPRDVLEPFARTAERGERLDPGNAFFPYMRAAAHLAAREDARCIAALERAGSAARWDDGERERRLARLRTAEAVYGKLSTVQRLAWDERGNPQAPRLLQMVAALSTRLAARAEARGEVETGWRIRRSLIRCGSLMSRQGCSMSVTTTGAAVVRIAMDDPFLAQPQGPDLSLSARDSIARAAERCAARLAGAGRTGDVEWVRGEAARAAAVFDLRDRAFGVGAPGTGMAAYLLREPLLRYAWVWAAGLWALSAAVWLLAIGGAGALLAPPAGRRWGLAAAGLALGGLMALGVVRTAKASLIARCAVIATRPYDWVEPRPTDGELAAAAALVMALPLAVSLAVVLLPPGRGQAGQRARGTGRAAWWLGPGCAAVVLYAGLATATAHGERRLAGDLDRFVTRDSAYLAGAAARGGPWSP